MKTKKVIFGLSSFVIIALCSLNIQQSFSISNEMGYSNILDLIVLNSASAEEGGTSCTGQTCSIANGHKYSTKTEGGKTTCCGIVDWSSGKKKA